MKKYFFTLLLIVGVLFSFQTIAQDDEGLKELYVQDVNTFTFGPRVGVSSSLLNIDPDDGFGKNELKFGFTAGGFLRYQLSKKFALQVDAVYTQRGGQYETNGKIKLDFIDPEIKFIFNATTKFGKRRVLWDLFAGFQPSILVSAEFNETDIMDSLNSLGFDAIVGGSFYIGRFVLSSNIKFGLTDLNDGATFDNGVTPTFRSITSETTLAYRFGGKKK